MHLFLQICGVAGFGLLGLLYPELVEVRAGNASIELRASITSCIAFALISTYFIFG